MRATWYVLEDGRVVDPKECVRGANGELCHKSGVAVAKRGDTYSSRSVDLEEVREKPAGRDREMKPANSGKGYRTRAAKGE